MADEMRSADQLVKTIIETPGVLQEIQSRPAETLNRLAEQAKKQVVPRVLEQDRLIYRIVVSSLGLVVLFVVVGVIGLSFKNSGGTVAIPDVLTALGSAAIGALAGILAPSPAASR
jgi:predicted phage tail protein